MTRRAAAACIAAGLLATCPAQARDALGVFESWGAFRDDRPLRCYAIAEPARAGGGGRWRPFASVANWPGHKVRSQLHIRLSREVAADAPITLSIGDKRFDLVGGGADAWAPDPRTDTAIVAAMRSAPSMSVSARSRTGGGFADTYGLRGAATAIDAATLGCARRR